jgi:hypothetical protein
MDSPKTIFLVSQSGGEFDDKWTHNLEGRWTRENAETYIAELKAGDERTRSLDERTSLHKKEWSETNFAPTCEEREPIPKWKAGLRKEEITPEMRQTRKDIEARNMEKFERYATLQVAHLVKWEEARNEFLATLGVPENEWDSFDGNYYSSKYDTSYEIEEVVIR